MIANSGHDERGKYKGGKAGDLGLHHIVVNSAASTNVNYLGLKLLD